MGPTHEHYMEQELFQKEMLKWFGENMLLARLKAKLTSDELWERLQRPPYGPAFPKDCLHLFENGWHPELRLIDAAQIACALGVPLSSLLEEPPK